MKKYRKIICMKLKTWKLFPFWNFTLINYYFVEKIWECMFFLNPSENTIHWWNHYQEPPYLYVPVLVYIRIKFQSNYFCGKKCERLSDYKKTWKWKYLQGCQIFRKSNFKEGPLKSLIWPLYMFSHWFDCSLLSWISLFFWKAIQKLNTPSCFRFLTTVSNPSFSCHSVYWQYICTP